MHSEDLQNVLLSSHLSFISTPQLWNVALAVGSCHAPTRGAAMGVLGEELGMWRNEEVLP